MAMELWDPFHDMMTMRDVMNRMFQEGFTRPGQGMLPLDIAETDSAFEVQATMPGVKPEDVQITVQGNTLSIRGQTTSEEEHKNQNWITHERRSGSFARTVSLPAPVNVDAAQAEFENGVLKLTLPKAEEARARQIKVSPAKQIPAAGTESRTDTGTQG
jgi:HSP20 family protein